MKQRQIHSILLVITAFIWGIAFVAQSEGGDAVGPYTFNCVRSFLAAIVLLPVIWFFDKKGMTKKVPTTKKQKKDLWIGGICCGMALGVASNLQQLGLFYGSTAGKAGFLTACYIVLVPILGIFLKKKCKWNVWVGVLITVIGLYLLCINDKFMIQKSDVLLLLCALVFACHILIIDHFSPLVDGVRMSAIQFLVAGIISFVPMFWVDMQHSIEGIMQWAPAFTQADAWIPLLYAAIMSSGVGYTLQIIGQQGVHPTVASLLMSLESVFSVLAGWMILGQKLHARELGGCVLIFIAVVLAQLTFEKRKKNA